MRVNADAIMRNYEQIADFLRTASVVSEFLFPGDIELQKEFYKSFREEMRRRILTTQEGGEW